MTVKSILITGATDGIGLETARMLVSQGHHVLLHGRSPTKLEAVERELAALPGDASVESYVADLSSPVVTDALVEAVAARHDRLDVLINNAGVFKTGQVITADGLDVRFAVNTIAPWILTRGLLPLLGGDGRVVNLSSAAQAPVNPLMLTGGLHATDDFEVYAQSKLALTAWSFALAQSLGDEGPVVVAVNPGSLLGSKMVKEGFGVAGGDLRIGADILCRAALSEEFANATGRYFDNDAGHFAAPHDDATDPAKAGEILRLVEQLAARFRT